MDSVLLIVALGAVAAGFVQGLSGFGFGMVAMSFWAWTLEPRLAALLAVCGALTGQLVAAATVRRGLTGCACCPLCWVAWWASPLAWPYCPGWTWTRSRSFWARCWCCGARRC